MVKIGKTCKILCLAASLMMGSILSSLPTVASSASYTVFATRIGLVGYRTANGHVIQSHDHFVALPSTKVLCSNGGHEFEVRITYKGRSVVAPIWDVGPWNTKDDYWNPPQQREMWNDLPQGMPEAQAAYQNGYNGGKDQFGRTVTNPAGIDLADGTFWDDLGMTDNDWVTVEFLWAPAVSVRDSSPYFAKGSNSGHPEYWHTYTYDGTPDGVYNGHTYIWTYVGGMPSNPSEPDCWAEFRPHLSQAGRYDVYACFYADPQSSHRVPHTVYYSRGSTTVIVDQYAPNYFTWRKVKLGTWDFAAGSDTRVVVTDATGEPYNGTTTLNADTLEFVLISPTNNPPNQPASLSQLRSNGITAIAEGGITPESTAVFKGTVSDPDGDYVRLEIELRQIGEAFTGEPTSETISDFVPSGTEVSITRYGLVNADYHWQYRAKDSRGATSSWVEFGAPGNIDFTVHLNNPPNTPSSPSPSNHATDVSIAADLSWSGGDPDAGDTVTYDVYFGTTTTPPLASNDQLATTYDPGTLSYSTTYYWKIVATDNHGSSTEGPIWDFTTQSAPNQPPNQPSNVLPSDGATGVELTPTLKSSAFSDPNPGDVHAASQWQITTIHGDYSSPIFDSGTDTVNLIQISIPSGTLSYSTTYHWRVRHQDNHGAWSEWSVETSFTTMSPTVHDVAILNVEAHPTQVFQGSTVNITVVASNEGTETEAFNVTVYANTTVIQTTIVTLASKNSVTVTITWDTDGFAEGDYIISAYAWPVSGESDTADNTFVDGVVKIKMLGDVNGDEKVDYWDLFLLARAYGSVRGDPNWNEQADFNSDGCINYMDLYILARNYGTSGS